MSIYTTHLLQLCFIIFTAKKLLSEEEENLEDCKQK